MNPPVQDGLFVDPERGLSSSCHSWPEGSSVAVAGAIFQIHETHGEKPGR